MFKAMQFKGILGDNEMKKVGEFKGKNVELLIREMPNQPAQRVGQMQVSKVMNCTGMTPEQIVNRIINDALNHARG